MTKTPFEVRLELLQNAERLLKDEYYAKIDRLDRIRELHPTQYDVELSTISFPTREQIMRVANELKAFVDSK